MKLSEMLTLCAVCVVDLLAIAILFPWLINSAGALGLIALPFIAVILGWASIQQVSKIFNKKG